MDDNQLNKAGFYMSCCGAAAAQVRAATARGSAAVGGATYFNGRCHAVRFAEMGPLNFSAKKTKLTTKVSVCTVLGPFTSLTVKNSLQMHREE